MNFHFRIPKVCLSLDMSLVLQLFKSLGCPLGMQTKDESKYVYLKKNETSESRKERDGKREKKK